MTSVQLRTDSVEQRDPLVGQLFELLHLGRELPGQLFQKLQLVVHQTQIQYRQSSSRNHGLVSAQGMPGQDNSLVGFFWGHGESVAEGRAE